VISGNFVYLGAAISMIGSGAYAWSTLRGLTQPNRVTWLMWTIAPGLVFVSELQQGVGVQSVMTLSVGLGPLLVLTASFLNHDAVWKLGVFDVACGLASALGLVLWFVSSNATVGLALFMVADGLAGLPTVIKSWKAPETESYTSYLGALINGLLTLATVSVWTSAVVAFPIQIVLFNILEVSLISGRIGPRLRREQGLESSAPGERIIPSIKRTEENR
jgi:uncharacterized membrane protein